MDIASFETEHFFARHEFSTPYQLCNSDCETLSIGELLALSGGSLEEFGRERLGYTESAGNPRLRQMIAAGYESRTSDDVLVLGTPVEGIYLIARALLDPGDEVVVLAPAYDALINLFEHVVGAEHVRRWNFRETDDGWSLSLDELRGLLSSRTRMVVVNFPHNPTGYLPSEEFQKSLISMVEESGARLFCDEMYFGLIHDGASEISSAVDVSSKSLVLSGLSKTYGLPGLRSGWLVVADEALRAKLMNWKFYTSICAPVPSEYLSIAALAARDMLRKRSMQIIARNLETAEAFFARWPDLFTWRRPLAGSTALVGFNVRSVGELSEQLAREEGILIQSGRMLGSDDHHMRVGLGRADFPEVLERFEGWLQSANLHRGLS